MQLTKYLCLYYNKLLSSADRIRGIHSGDSKRDKRPMQKTQHLQTNSEYSSSVAYGRLKCH